jgi:hypothetical protein
MALEIACEKCAARLRLPDRLAGRMVRCSRCKVAFTAPEACLDAVPADDPPEEGIRTSLPPPRAKGSNGEQSSSDEPPRKKKRKKKRATATAPGWAVWVVSGCAFATAFLTLGMIALSGMKIQALIYLLFIIVMLPISTGILILAMFIASAIGGGIDFGDARVVIPKAAALLLVCNIISLAPCGILLALPIWWGGLMKLFNLDFWECRILLFVNWLLNYLVRMAVFAAIVAALTHPNHGPVGDLPDADPAGNVEGIEAIGGRVELNNARDPQVERITLAGTLVTDEDLPKLQGFPRLRSVDLSDTRISDAGLLHIALLERLEDVTLTRTAVTDTGVKRLQRLRPKLRIHR